MCDLILMKFFKQRIITYMRVYHKYFLCPWRIHTPVRVHFKDICQRRIFTTVWVNLKIFVVRSSTNMWLCVFVRSFVTFRLLRFVKKNVCLIRPSSYCLIHFGVSSGAARRRKKTFSTVRIRMGKLAWVSALQFWAQHNYDKTRNNGMSVNFAIWYFKQYTDGALWASTTE